MRAVVVGGGIAGLAAARRLEALLPDASVVLVEKDGRLGGKIVTERTEGFVIEGAPDSFLSRKERGVGLCEELGLGDELVGRRPENARSFVRRGAELLPLPEGLTGMIPTDLRALEASELLSEEGRARLAAEPEIPPELGDEDESVASFVSRRLGREAYEAFVEPLMTGIYGGDGEQLSLAATFPNLRALELEHGSLLRGLSAQPASESRLPPFVDARGRNGQAGDGPGRFARAHGARRRERCVRRVSRKRRIRRRAPRRNDDRGGRCRNRDTCVRDGGSPGRSRCRPRRSPCRDSRTRRRRS